jgi:hypothetical protein
LEDNGLWSKNVARIFHGEIQDFVFSACRAAREGIRFEKTCFLLFGGEICPPGMNLTKKELKIIIGITSLILWGRSPREFLKFNDH